MVQQNERFSERVVFYIMPSVRARFENAVSVSGMQQADWLRHWLEDTLVRLESGEIAASGGMLGDVGDVPIASKLAAALAQIEGMEQVNVLLRERLGMADAHNLELNKRLEESHAVVERVTLALPAPAEDAGGRRSMWRFWGR